MGLFKGILFAVGMPVRITTKKQRMYRQQMGYPATAGDALDNLTTRIFRGQQSHGGQVLRSGAVGDDRVPCPTCAEMIMPAAVKCRFCNEQTNFPKRAAAHTNANQGQHRPASQKNNQTSMTRTNGNTKQCPSCKCSIARSATRCRFCKKDV